YSQKPPQTPPAHPPIINKEPAPPPKVHNPPRLSGCERNETSCSHTHKTGCGHWCKYYAAQANAARAELARVKPLDQRRVAALKAKIADWQRSESAETSRRVSAIAGDRDLLARAQALSTIEKKHHEVSQYVLFV